MALSHILYISVTTCSIRNYMHSDLYYDLNSSILKNILIFPFFRFLLRKDVFCVL